MFALSLKKVYVEKKIIGSNSVGRGISEEAILGMQVGEQDPNSGRLEPQHWGWKEENLYSRENGHIEMMLNICDSLSYQAPTNKIGLNYRASGWQSGCVLAD